MPALRWSQPVRPVVLSASSVGSYLACGYQWFLGFVEGRPDTQNVKAAVGVAVHAGAEELLRAKMEGHPEPDARGVVIDTLAKSLLDTRHDPKLSPTEAIRSALACLDTFRRDILPAARPVAVEQPFQFQIDDGIPYSGIIDWLDDDEVWDLKTTGSRPRDGKRYDLAMTGYALGKRELTGRDETDIVLGYIVRTRKPYHWPIRRGGPATDDDIDRFAAIVGGVARGIAAAEYRPTGLENGSCAYCNFRESCEFYAALNEGGSNG